MIPNDETVFRTAASASEAKEPSPPRGPDVSIPGVALGACLGRGGMAVVYEAFDDGFRPPRRVAVKLMDSTLSAEPNFRARFEREATIVANFRHDSIVRVFGSGETRGHKYILMEYLGGGTLSRQLESGPLEMEAALRIAARMADALAHSHARGIVHRDFKPGNVLFTDDGQPVLSDFGIAKDLLGDGTELTRGVMAIGAPKYMSPEQLRGEPVTDRTDVYSWGLTLFEMLTGRVQRETGDSSGLAILLPGVAPPVVDLIGRCLQETSSLRPPAAECHDVLFGELDRASAVDIGAGAAAGAGQKSLITSVHPDRARWWWTVRSWPTVIVLACLSGIGLYVWPHLAAVRRTPQPQAPRATVATENARVPAQNPTMPLGNPASPAVNGAVLARNVCGRPPSARSVDALVDEGLKAQVAMSFARTDTEQQSAADAVRTVADCLRKLHALGYETAQSRRWISDVEGALAQRP